MPVGIDYWFGLVAVAGFVLYVLSLIAQFVFIDAQRVWRWLTRSNQPTIVKATMEEMYDSTPYAAARNAKQELMRRKP